VINVQKEYQKSFLVEPSKLGRLIDKIHERLRQNQNATLQDMFQVFFTGDRREDMTELDDVLALDNSRKKKIKRLAITCSSSLGAARSDKEVQVDFARPKPTATGTTNIVAVSVRSDNVAWANSTFAEVEEQVERYWLYNERPILVLLVLLLVALILIASQIAPPGLSLSSQLTSTDLDRIEAMLAQRPTLTDEDLREVSTMQWRNILDARRAMRSPQEYWTRRTLFWALPLSVVVVCIVILLTTYPGAVFLWGDEVKRYESAQQRRKAIWGIIIGITLLGVSASFFSAAILSWLPR
jgi:hypothetical protein